MKTNIDSLARVIPATSRIALVALVAAGALLGCSESITVEQADAASMDASFADSARVDATSAADAGVDADLSDARAIRDASVGDVPEDAARTRYGRDVRPLLEASACGDCHAGVGVEMDYAWISAPGETWCSGADYERRWNCFEEHARTQTVAEGQGCGSDFYHRHGEPCFMEEARLQILGWAADGYLE